jgi:hypothetical protein
VDEHEDLFAGVGAADADVAELAGVAEGKFSGPGKFSRCRCQAIMTGPASSPAVCSSRRRARMRALTASLVRRGLLSGRLERGSTAAIPPAASRRRRSCAQRRLTLYRRAASATLSPWSRTARTMTFCFDMHHAQQFRV